MIKGKKNIVVKFGGSSLTDENKLSRAVKAVAKEFKKGTGIAVVVSAMGKTTDLLLDTAKEACEGVLTGAELDDILSMGERTSARIFSTALKVNNVRCRYLDPFDPDWPIITDESFNNAKPILPYCEKMIKEHVMPSIEEGMVVVIPGFIGKTKDGRMTTLGRGGSDTTAMIVAGALSADQVILVTNVNGILTADPKLIKNPRRLDDIHVNTLTGIADSGTKFIHKKSLYYKNPSIDVKVINHKAGELNTKGTIIHGSLTNYVTVERVYSLPAMSVTIVGSALSEAPQLVMDVFNQIKKAEVSIFGVSINNNSLILYLPERDSDELLEALHTIVVNNEKTMALAVRRNLAFVKVKGVGLEETPGIINRIAEALFYQGVNIFGIFTITSSVLVFVDFDDGEQALKLIRESVQVNQR